jgi:leucyl aminopeptidase
MIETEAKTLKDFLAADEPLALFACEDGLAGAWPAPARRRSLFERAKEEGFSGKSGETSSFTAPLAEGSRRIILVGLGKRSELSAAARRKGAAALWRFAKTRFASVGLLPLREPGPETEGFLLASYAFTRYKTPQSPARLARLSLLAADASARKRAEAEVRRAALLAEAIFFVRDLVNESPSAKTPDFMAKAAQDLAGGGVTVKVLDAAACSELGMGALLGVGRGAAQPPKLLHLVYRPQGKAAKRVALVGKGVLFDSGGLSLKPAAGMETMKCDMAGAATVLGLFKILPRLGVSAEVHGLAPLAYNLPGPDACKPGDVLRAKNGKTIEVLNTDAEGRLVLADALCHAADQSPDAILDFATLTGAVVTALGNSLTGAMTNDRALLRRLLAAAQTCGEEVWELPLFAGYRENIESDIADLRNISKARGEAGSIIGGLFLKEFVGQVPWVHFDFAGTAWSDKGSDLGPAGATGALVRTVACYLRGL